MCGGHNVVCKQLSASPTSTSPGSPNKCCFSFRQKTNQHFGQDKLVHLKAKFFKFNKKNFSNLTSFKCFLETNLGIGIFCVNNALYVTLSQTLVVPLLQHKMALKLVLRLPLTYGLEGGFPFQKDF